MGKLYLYLLPEMSSLTDKHTNRHAYLNTPPAPWGRHSNKVKYDQKNTHTHTRLTALFPGLPRSASTRKVKTNLDFTEARDSELQWYQLGHTQICTSLQTDNHASTPPLRFLQAGCPSCCPTNSIKALKGKKKDM